MNIEYTGESKAAYKATVIKLHSNGVLQDVAPPQIRFVLLLGIRWVEEFILWWAEPSAHQGELVVHETRIETRDECTYTPRMPRIRNSSQIYRNTHDMHQITQ